MPFVKKKSRIGKKNDEVAPLALGFGQIECSVKKIVKLSENPDLCDMDLIFNLPLNNVLHVILKLDDSLDVKTVFSKDQVRVLIDALRKISELLVDSCASPNSASYKMLENIIEARDVIGSLVLGRYFRSMESPKLKNR